MTMRNIDIPADPHELFVFAACWPCTHHLTAAVTKKRAAMAEITNARVNSGSENLVAGYVQSRILSVLLILPTRRVSPYNRSGSEAIIEE
jgi:hypothetical protein